MRLPGWKPLFVTSAIVVAVSLSVGGGTTFVALEVTTRPEFCKSCHIMEPYYESWASSSHAHVSCVDCHYEPGLLETFEGKFKALSQLAKYVTSTEGSKPWAEVSDYSCMRSGCHSTRLLEGEIQFGRIRFDHREHLIGLRRGEKLRCTSCHSQIVQGDHLTVTTSSCILCHFKSPPQDGSRPMDDCALCHGPPPEEIELAGGVAFRHADYLERGVECRSCHADVTRGDGAVPKERCGSCHNQQEHLERIGDVDFMHSNHVTNHSVTCLDCHLEIQHGLPPPAEHAQGRCEDCHAGTHDAGSDLYAGRGGRGVAEHPGAMYLARVTCEGCHRAPFPDAPLPAGGATWKADPIACLDCHGPGFDGMVERWQAEAGAAADRVRSGVEALHAELTGAGAAPPEVQRHWEDAAHNLSMVLLDGSRGAHNLPYARDLLAQAAQDVQAGWTALGLPRPAPDMAVGPTVPSEGNCTTLCHVGIEALQVSTAAGMPFDHGPHVLDLGLDCSTCHADEPHGAPPPAGATCLSCHHTVDEPDTCVTCHADVAALRAETLPGHDRPLPMQGLECVECHIALDRGEERQAAEASCGLCHAGEGMNSRPWVEGATEPLAEVEALLPGLPPPEAAVARARLAFLRRAGPWHNRFVSAAEATRLRRELQAAPVPEPPAAGEPDGQRKP